MQVSHIFKWMYEAFGVERSLFSIQTIIQKNGRGFPISIESTHFPRPTPKPNILHATACRIMY